MRHICKLLNAELLSLRRHTDTPIHRHQPFVVAAPPRYVSVVCSDFGVQV
jgi:hypothetical protein